MPRKQTQFNFTSGELDPLLLGRTDIDRYYSAAEEMTNVRTLPQGGFKRDDGLNYIKEIVYIEEVIFLSPSYTAPNGGNTNNLETNGASFQTTTNISTIDPYVVVQWDFISSVSVAFLDIRGASLTASSNDDEFFLQVSNDAASWTTLGDPIEMSTTPTDVRKRVNGFYRYARFVKIGGTNLGTTKVNLTGFIMRGGTTSTQDSRLVPFEFSSSQSYMLLLTSGNITIFKDGEYITDVIADNLFNVASIDYTQSADTAIFVEEVMRPKQLIRQGSDTKWSFSNIEFKEIPQFDFDPVITTPTGTLTPSDTSGIITLTASSAPPFSSSSVGQYLQGAGGRARILEFISTTEVRAVTEIPFYSTTAIATGDWEYLTGFEDVWSSSRGWPKTVTFHKGRLYFGGTTSRPQTIWGSKINLFFDFDLGSLFDDDAIDATLNTDQINQIVNIKSTNGNLLIFTTGSEFSVIDSNNQGITPQNFSPVPVSQFGSEENFRVGSINNQNIFIQRGGKSIIRYAYDTIQQISDSENISLLSSHLISSPFDFAIRPSTSTQETDLILFIDGSNRLIYGTALFTQNVIGFSKRLTTNSTSGKFYNVGVDISEIYTVVERTVNGETKRYVEIFNDDAFLDSSVMYTSGFPTDTFTGLDHLEGETVKVIADGSVLTDQVVTGGSVTIERDAEESCEIGLDFEPRVKTLPLEFLGLGTQIGRKKRISGATLRLYNTSNFVVNDAEYEVSFRGFGEAGAGSPLNEPPVLFSGDKKVQGILGWAERQQLIISQNEPLDLQVLSITMDINL